MNVILCQPKQKIGFALRIPTNVSCLLQHLIRTEYAIPSLKHPYVRLNNVEAQQILHARTRVRFVSSVNAARQQLPIRPVLLKRN